MGGVEGETETGWDAGSAGGAWLVGETEGEDGGRD